MQLLARLRGRIRRAAEMLRTRTQSEEALATVSMEYWNRGDIPGVDVRDYSHWRGAGPWSDEARWLALGRVHFEMYARLCAYAGVNRPLANVVEWGPGGGANAIHFVNEAVRYCGVEIAQASLDECGRVLREAGFHGFEPVLISAERPEDVLAKVDVGFDLFLSTYVFELIPGRTYGERIARVAHALLRHGGLALIQIRYDDGTERSRQRTGDYYRYADRFTSYRIDDFWRRMTAIGFRPLYVQLVPERVEGFSGDLYAYFALLKPALA